MSASVQSNRQVPLLDLTLQYAEIRDELMPEVVRVLESQKFILGEDVARLESEIARYCNTEFAVGCASGSDALYLALIAAGIGPRDRVATTPFTFFATAGSISRAGAIPVFVDIDPVTFNMDPARLAETLKLTKRVKAVIPVHLFGGCADMDPIVAAAKRARAVVIEDAAQAIGAEYNGRRAGSIGDIGCISFFPSKNLGGFGDGGMLTTNDASRAKLVAALRVHGSAEKYLHERIGINSRLDAFQAAILSVKLRHLDAWTDRRRDNADFYRSVFAGRTPLVLPWPAPYQTRHVYNQFVVRYTERDRLKAYLQEHGVGTEVYYPVPLHLQACYAQLGYREGAFPESERAAAEVLALPIHSALPAGDREYVAYAVDGFFS